jgi:hypothetical protein
LDPDSNTDPESDPDPELITDPDPNLQIISDPAGSGSGCTTLVLISILGTLSSVRIDTVADQVTLI